MQGYRLPNKGNARVADGCVTRVIVPNGNAQDLVHHVGFRIALTAHAARIVGGQRRRSRDQLPNQPLHLTATATRIVSRSTRHPPPRQVIFSDYEAVAWSTGGRPVFLFSKEVCFWTWRRLFGRGVSIDYPSSRAVHRRSQARTHQFYTPRRSFVRPRFSRGRRMSSV